MPRIDRGDVGPEPCRVGLGLQGTEQGVRSGQREGHCATFAGGNLLQVHSRSKPSPQWLRPLPHRSPSTRTFDPQTGQAVAVADGLVRVTAPNPGPYTFTGTNSFVLGRERVMVVDPGPDVARASRGAEGGDRRAAGRGDPPDPHAQGSFAARAGAQGGDRGADLVRRAAPAVAAAAMVLERDPVARRFRLATWCRTGCLSMASGSSSAG